MRSRTVITSVALALLVVSHALVRCGSSSVKIGRQAGGSFRRKRARYSLFDSM